MLCTMVPIGMEASCIALPGFTSALTPETTMSPTLKRCGARIYDKVAS